MSMYPPIHRKTPAVSSFDRLEMLWERYPKYRERQTFSTLEELLEEHESYRKDFDELREEYVSGGFDRFLVQLSWADLPYRYETRELIQKAPALAKNPMWKLSWASFRESDTDRKACFLFPESYIPQFFVITEVCRKAEKFRQIRSLFPDEEKVHYLAVFDKQNMDDVLLMFHLLYTNSSEDLYGGYSLYDYSLPWYQNHLWEEGIPLRSPWLPDRLAKYQGNLPWYHNPVKTVYVRRNIRHMLECGYFSSELELFRNLTESDHALLPVVVHGSCPV